MCIRDSSSIYPSLRDRDTTIDEAQDLIASEMISIIGSINAEHREIYELYTCLLYTSGDVAIENGTMIYTSGINEDGHLTLADTFDLPNGVYYLKELSTNGQYVLNDNEYDFEIAYHGEDVSKYTVKIGNDGIINNELARGMIQVKKTDKDNESKVLSDVPFNISAKEDMSEICLLYTSRCV